MGEEEKQTHAQKKNPQQLGIKTRPLRNGTIVSSPTSLVFGKGGLQKCEQVQRRRWGKTPPERSHPPSRGIDQVGGS